ncbi:Uncharacterised protein [Mycobacteroides abscessus subsp. abscessus]|nr:Uncharacterised protein [Mycobacteroides abscessus subsp. abscessus]
MGVVVRGISGGDGVGAIGGRRLDDLAQARHRVVAGAVLGLVTHVPRIPGVSARDGVGSPDTAAVDRDHGTLLENLRARAVEPCRQLDRGRQIGARGEDEGTGIGGGL